MHSINPSSLTVLHPTEYIISFLMVPNVLPGEDLVTAGIRDLACGIESDTALLVSIGAPRLSRLGLPVANPLPDPEHRLYASLAAVDRASAHSHYNALIRRLVSFEQAAERAQSKGG